MKLSGFKINNKRSAYAKSSQELFIMYKDQEMYVPFSENVQFVQIAMSGSHMPSYMHAHYDGI